MEQRITELDKYTLIIYDNAESLVQSVNEKIEEGWKPLGGVAVAVVPNAGLLYAQAMIFERTWWE